MKKIILHIIVIIAFILVWNFVRYVATNTGVERCAGLHEMMVGPPVKARHLIIPFYTKTFDDNCDVPQTWEIIED